MTAQAQPIGGTGRRALLAAVVLTIGLYLVPGGDIVARPLVWVSTLAHELGHAGVTAGVGGDVASVHVYADGSGVAAGTRPPGRLRTAAIAAGGLVGPAVVAAILFALARAARTARISAGVLAAGLVATIPFALRGLLTITVAVVLALLLAATAMRARPAASQLLLVFLAVQLALSVFSRGDYLFTDTASTATGPQPSDSAQIAEALIGPYWFWGGLCGLVSLVVLCVGVVTFLHSAGRGSPDADLPS